MVRARPRFGETQKTVLLCVMPVESGIRNIGFVASVAGTFPRRKRKHCLVAQAVGILIKSRLAVEGTASLVSDCI